MIPLSISIFLKDFLSISIFFRIALSISIFSRIALSISTIDIRYRYIEQGYLAVLHLPLSPIHSLTANLEVGHKEWPLKLETLQIFDQLDKQTKRQKIKRQKIKDKKTYTIFLILWCQGSFTLLRCFQTKAISLFMSNLFLSFQLRFPKHILLFLLPAKNISLCLIIRPHWQMVIWLTIDIVPIFGY